MDSFKYAFRGIKDALATEPNLKIHITLGILSVILGIFLKINFTEWSILFLTIFLVICLELINTIFEKTMDMVSPQKSERVRLIKDMSSAVVLLSAICACLVGFWLFLPKILTLF